MAEACFSDRPITRRAVAAVAVVAGLGVALVGPLASGRWASLPAAAVVAALAAGLAAWLGIRHRVRVSDTALVVGGVAAGGFAVQLGAIDHWRVLARPDAFELRVALRGMGRVAFLPWLPAAAFLVDRDGRPYLVGTRRPTALHAALAGAVPYREAVGDLAALLDAERVPQAEQDVGASSAAVTGMAAMLLLGATAVFGVLISLIVLDALSRLPGTLAVTGMVAGPVLGALVVVEATSRTPLSAAGRAALAAVCAGMAPPVAAALGGAPLTATVLLGLLTVPVALVTATLHPGTARR